MASGDSSVQVTRVWFWVSLMLAAHRANGMPSFNPGWYWRSPNGDTRVTPELGLNPPRIYSLSVPQSIYRLDDRDSRDAWDDIGTLYTPPDWDPRAISNSPAGREKTWRAHVSEAGERLCSWDDGPPSYRAYIPMVQVDQKTMYTVWIGLANHRNQVSMGAC